MAEKLTFQYDREADILYVNAVPPYAGQESQELEDEIIVRLNPKTGRVENFEVCSLPAACFEASCFPRPSL